MRPAYCQVSLILSGLDVNCDLLSSKDFSTSSRLKAGEKSVNRWATTPSPAWLSIHDLLDGLQSKLNAENEMFLIAGYSNVLKYIFFRLIS